MDTSICNQIVSTPDVTHLWWIRCSQRNPRLHERDVLLAGGGLIGSASINAFGVTLCPLTIDALVCSHHRGGWDVHPALLLVWAGRQARHAQLIFLKHLAVLVCILRKRLALLDAVCLSVVTAAPISILCCKTLHIATILFCCIAVR